MDADVIVIGAGASGLVCAAEAAKRGRKTVILEGSGRIGSKVAVSGGGRCNFTNLHVSADHYLSANPHFCRSALSRFTPEHFIALMKRHRMPFSEKEDGQLFSDRGSRPVIEMLRTECLNAGVKIILSCQAGTVEKEDRFSVETGKGRFSAASVVIATGGLSYRSMGATDFGLRIARNFGLKLVEPRPGLAPFMFHDWKRTGYADLSGVSLPVSVRCHGKAFTSAMVFTHRGLSGPAVLQASSYWQKGDAIEIDLFPDMDVEVMLFSNRFRKLELKTVLGQHLPKRLADLWCSRCAPSRPLSQYAEKELRRISHLLKHWELVPTATEGYDHAEVTVGGVDTRELSSKTMEAKKVAGLFFTGEVVDVTGQLGGYNLHWAWASGYAAGQSV